MPSTSTRPSTPPPCSAQTPAANSSATPHSWRSPTKSAQSSPRHSTSRRRSSPRKSRTSTSSDIVTFINGLSDRELNALPSVTVPSERRIKVELRMYGRGWAPCCLNRQDLDSLHRWLVRCEHPTKRGADVEVSCEVLGEYVDRHLCNTQRAASERMARAAVSEGRVYSELKKFVAALEAQKP
ncbi:hypothetical protein LTR12_011423 [Friedmanniomyces endolithicus]|nr:hypothetical protein LTR12_011423 [Friedmanniomyces endolithicus]